MKVVIVLVVGVMVVIVVVVMGMLVVVVGVVDKRKATTITINTANTIHTIPQPNIQIDKLFLNISVTHKTDITTTITILPLPSIPY